MKKTRVDLHVHSRHSNKPSYWALRKFRCPESFTEPERVYRAAKEQGMDFVTITDHNGIRGALEIAHQPDVIVGSELTVSFPDDGCKVHVVALGLTEAVFDDLQRLRHNVFELASYLQTQRIPHFVAHLLYAQNDKLSADHVEQLLLLFNHFEVRNGTRARRTNLFTEQLLAGLTPERIDHLANRHDLDPLGETPWVKGTVGGSDDHSGLFIGRACTATRAVGTPAEFLAALWRRDTWAEGEHGDPLTLAHSLYGIGYSFYQSRVGRRSASRTPFVQMLLNRYLAAEPATPPLGQRLRLFLQHRLPCRLQWRATRTLSYERLLDQEARTLLRDPELLARLGEGDRNRKIFTVTSHLANRMLYQATRRLLADVAGEGLAQLMNAAGSIGLTHLLVSPYYLAFHHQHRDKGLMAALDERLQVTPGEVPEKIALFTDTLHDINGVAITIKRLIQTAKARGIALTVLTCSEAPTGYADGVMNFQSLGDLSIPEYPELKLRFPPILNILDYCEREGFTRLHISTPGTMGAMGLLISRMMKLPTEGTYHTDIPQYVRDLTDDEFLEKAAWQFMIGFYGMMDAVLIPSSSTREQLVAHGLPAEKARPLPRWVDAEQYHPHLRRSAVWAEEGLGEGVRLLYVGRVSKEKNLHLLTRAFRVLATEQPTAQLVVVGDGPYRAEMERELAGTATLFTGFRGGAELAELYASADLFVFPSTTDTFGNVVLEAQASGLPVIVSDQGGPKELMRHGETGIVCPADDLDALVAAMRRLAGDELLRHQLGQQARTFIEEGARSQPSAYSTILQPRVANG